MSEMSNQRYIVYEYQVPTLAPLVRYGGGGGQEEDEDEENERAGGGNTTSLLVVLRSQV